MAVFLAIATFTHLLFEILIYHKNTALILYFGAPSTKLCASINLKTVPSALNTLKVRILAPQYIK